MESDRIEISKDEYNSLVMSRDMSQDWENSIAHDLVDVCRKLSENPSKDWTRHSDGVACALCTVFDCLRFLSNYDKDEFARKARSKARPWQERLLKHLLDQIREFDLDYDVRYGLVLHAIYVAHEAGFKAGFNIEIKEPEWAVAYIELPTGQVSWHLPRHVMKYDGHSTIDKYRRIKEWINEPGSRAWRNRQTHRT